MYYYLKFKTNYILGRNQSIHTWAATHTKPFTGRAATLTLNEDLGATHQHHHKALPTCSLLPTTIAITHCPYPSSYLLSCFTLTFTHNFSSSNLFVSTGERMH